jgi:hypothetical protein
MARSQGGRAPIFEQAMTATERQRRWRAKRAGKPLPIDREHVRKVVTAALEALICPMTDEVREQWAWWAQRRIFAALDGEPGRSKAWRR